MTGRRLQPDGLPEIEQVDVSQVDSVKVEVTQAEGGWLNAPDGARLYFRQWLPESPRAAVLYLHGIEGHSDWFSTTAKALAASEIAVYAVDRRGAGRSEGPRGHLRGLSELLDDVGFLLSTIREANPQLPMFLFGNCWGAKAAVVAAARAEGSLAGLILSSPAIAVRVDVPVVTKLKMAVAFLTGNPRPFSIPLTPAMFTDNPEYLRYIETDPLRLTEATAGFFVNSAVLTVLARRAFKRLRLPILVAQSGRDDIVDVDYVKRWVPSAGELDHTLSILEDARHSLDFDRSPDVYHRLISGWILERSESPAEGRP